MNEYMSHFCHQPMTLLPPLEKGVLMMKGQTLFLALAVGLMLFSTGGDEARAASVIHAAGATFPHPIYAWWALRYGREHDMHLEYNATGSGGGISRIEKGTVDFGASDAPLSQKELDEYGMIQFPTVLGGVVPVLNVPGVASGELHLTGTLLADIFMGKIKNWNDPALRSLNSDLNLPDIPIRVVHRIKGSGTTWIFTNYLSKVSPEWRDRLGNHKLIKWPVGKGAYGNSGIIDKVNQIMGAIGYCEYSYVVQSNGTYALMKNFDGYFVEPTQASFKAAAGSVDWSKKGADIVLTNKGGRNTWPIAGATFILMYKKQRFPEAARRILSFFDWCYREGDLYAEGIDYVTLSDTVKNDIRHTWGEELHGLNGEQIWPIHP